MTHTCCCIQRDPTAATTFTPNTQYKRPPLLLCAFHAKWHRDGRSFMVFPMKESK